MKVAHLLRKYHPDEWAGTESAVLMLLEGLRRRGIDSKIFCPLIDNPKPGPFEKAGFEVCRVKSFLTLWGLTPESRSQLVSIGGDLFSLELLKALWQEPGLSLIHAHTLGMFGGSALTIARARGIPVVVSIHGGSQDLPRATKDALEAPRKNTFNWGKPLLILLQAKYLVRNADLILTCNPREAELLQSRYPKQKIVVSPHAIDASSYSVDCRQEALEAYPELADSQFLIVVARIDPVKNQLWLVEQFPAILEKHPHLKLVMAGPCTDMEYGQKVQQRIAELNLQHHILITGAFPNGDSKLKGLLQLARGMILPSLAEPFGLVILEAWAAGTPVLSSRSSGPESIIEDGQTGWLFDVDETESFRVGLEKLLDSSQREYIIAKAKKRVFLEYDVNALGKRMQATYQTLITSNSHH